MRNIEYVRRAKRKYKTTPAGKYIKQKERAKVRGIDWRFTFEEWMNWWGDDFVLRGRGPGKLAMGRVGDIGPYSPENCIKIDHNKNLQRIEQ